MNVSEVLTEAYGRLPDLVRSAVVGLSAEQLRWTPAPGTNPVGWLVWHLARVEDSHIAEILDQDQIWVAAGWAGRFGLEPEPTNSGYGHTAAEVAAVRPESAAALVEYHDAVAARTRELLRGLTEKDLDRIVDEYWDPPVTLGVRLISVVNDEIQHVGQAAYVRGLIQ